MQIKIFNINVTSSPEEQEEMNRFLRGHRVLTVDKHYDDSRGLWTFAVTYIEGQFPSSGEIGTDREN